MKKIKLFEEFQQFDPWSDLKGDDLKVFQSVETLCSSIENDETIQKAMYGGRMEPIITAIVDQNQDGGPKNFPEDKQYYVFVKNWTGKNYIEVETGIQWERDEMVALKPDFSSHGSPASYGKSVYSFSSKTGKIEYDKEFFRSVLNK